MGYNGGDIMAKNISRRKLMKGLIKEIDRIGKLLTETDPNQTYQERRKTTDKKGNEIEVECTVCPYNDLLKQQSELIEAYDKLKAHSISAESVMKTMTSIGMFGAGLMFETGHTFTFETVRNFLRKPK